MMYNTRKLRATIAQLKLVTEQLNATTKKLNELVADKSKSQ